MSDKHVFIVSDALGQTGERVLKAAALQFNTKFLPQKFRQIRTTNEIDEIINFAKQMQALVIYTIVIPQLNDYIKEQAKLHQINSVDILESSIQALSTLLGESPQAQPMLGYELDEGYFKKIEALEYTSRNDDGRHPEELHKADVILLGVSRVSKTPLSYYLANNEGLKVSNIPLISGVTVPKEIYELPKDKIIGLHVNPERLKEIRTARNKKLSLQSSTKYNSLETIYEEIDFALSIYKKMGCYIIDMSNKNIEEAATDIIDLLTAKGLI